jgi:hypothetical protein
MCCWTSDTSNPSSLRLKRSAAEHDADYGVFKERAFTLHAEPSSKARSALILSSEHSKARDCTLAAAVR